VSPDLHQIMLSKMKEDKTNYYSTQMGISCLQLLECVIGLWQMEENEQVC
jgi:hypothetical protein